MGVDIHLFNNENLVTIAIIETISSVVIRGPAFVTVYNGFCQKSLITTNASSLK